MILPQWINGTSETIGQELMTEDRMRYISSADDSTFAAHLSVKSSPRPQAAAPLRPKYRQILHVRASYPDAYRKHTQFLTTRSAKPE
ncbi:hypothetical protein CERSUDRAFT_101535 [Gelatoporia subvermispora B]|uniref:Uncharacterized protein n=1 Tax=Ceriporiopsis subvermispora (strain B) TaxID=914234 RepID=M2P542_CERS8|nr:hypothetical protein CERSUDRAFT_101535 [Gelatoporia subvermispora B]